MFNRDIPSVLTLLNYRYILLWSGNKLWAMQRFFFFFNISSLKLVFMTKDMLHLGEYSWAFENKSSFANIGWSVYYVSYIPLVNCIFQICIPPDFPPLPALSVLIRDAKVSNYNFRYAYIPLESILFFFSCTLRLSCLVYINL